MGGATSATARTLWTPPTRRLLSGSSPRSSAAGTAARRTGSTSRSAAATTATYWCYVTDTDELNIVYNFMAIVIVLTKIEIKLLFNLSQFNLLKAQPLEK